MRQPAEGIQLLITVSALRLDSIQPRLLFSTSRISLFHTWPSSMFSGGLCALLSVRCSIHTRERRPPPRGRVPLLTPDSSSPEFGSATFVPSNSGMLPDLFA